jgi:hypothetical protein
MNHLVLTGFLSALLACPLLRADAGPAPDLLTEALPALQSGYVDFPHLQLKAGDRLRDLVDQSQGELELEPAAAENAAPPPILAALLPGQIIYYRFASFVPAAGWSDFATQLGQWMARGAGGIVLDLRSNASPDDVDGAARVAGFFTPSGTPFFTIEDSRGAVRPYPGTNSGGTLVTQPIVVLTDNRTTGAAEALAACLKADGALVIGQSTSGKGALFAEKQLSSGQVLRYVVGKVSLADGSPLWNHPVAPDIGLMVDGKKEAAALALIAQNQVLEVIGEPAERHRLSEAALVRGEDPEIETDLISPDGKNNEAGKIAPVTQDRVLVDALDSLKAIRLTQSWTAAPPAGSAAAPGEIPSSVQ